MAINFKKLRSQIKPFDPEKNSRERKGYIFIATDEQDDIFSIARGGSKRGLIACLVEIIKYDKAFKQEFSL